MKKLILALGLSTALTLSFASMANAAPNSQMNVLASREEIRAFQKANGLKVDGIVGPRTRAAMVEKGYKLNPTNRNVKPQSNREPVKVVASKNPFIKCQFLFWEVDCANPEYTENRNTSTANNDSVDQPRYQTNNFLASGHKNIAKAQKYVGLHGKTNRQEVKAIISKPFDKPIDPARIPWCAAFANAILRENNFDTTDSLMARSFLTYGVATKAPSEGDIVVLKRGRSNYTGHVGFYVNTVTMNGQTYVAVLGGNQGKAINVAYYPINRVLAYRKPV